MKWARSLFQLWLVFTIVWFGVLAFNYQFSVPNKDLVYWTVKEKNSSYLIGITPKSFETDKRFQMFGQKVVFSPFIQKTKGEFKVAVPEGWSNRTSPAEKESFLASVEDDIWREHRKILVRRNWGFFIPPFVLITLGAALLWLVGGFKQN